MQLSKHAAARSRQRGIPYDEIELILGYGTPRRKPGGAREYVLRRSDKAQVTAHLKQLIQCLDSAVGKGVLVGEDGTVITIYHIRQ